MNDLKRRRCEDFTMVGAIGSSGTYILPANEKMYHTSNLLGQWSGTWGDGKHFTFKILSIKNKSAQIEYDHDGKKEIGTGTVDKNTITYGNLTIVTRDGKSGLLQFKYGSMDKHVTVAKTAATATRG
jgi:hypothetical protein